MFYFCLKDMFIMIKKITKTESDNIKIPGYQELLGKDVEIWQIN